MYTFFFFSIFTNLNNVSTDNRQYLQSFREIWEEKEA